MSNLIRKDEGASVLRLQLPTMAEQDTRFLSLEHRNQTLMGKIRSLQTANANLKLMISIQEDSRGEPPSPPRSLISPVFSRSLQNSKLKEENEVIKSREKLLLRDNEKIKQKVHHLKELQESLQDDIYVLEEQLCACTCQGNDKRDENIEPLGL